MNINTTLMLVNTKLQLIQLISVAEDEAGNRGEQLAWLHKEAGKKSFFKALVRNSVISSVQTTDRH